MKVSLSEKGGWPNTLRILVGGGLLVLSGVLFQRGDTILGFGAIGLAVFLLGMSVSHNLFDNNYLIGYDAGYQEGSRARGLISPEEEMREGNYEVLASAPLGDDWLVAVRDLNKTNSEERVYRLKAVPPQFFRRERWKNPNTSDLNAYIPGYAQIKRPV